MTAYDREKRHFIISHQEIKREEKRGRYKKTEMSICIKKKHRILDPQGQTDRLTRLSCRVAYLLIHIKRKIPNMYMQTQTYAF